ADAACAVDTLDVTPRAFIDGVDDAHSMGRLVALEAWPYLAESVPLLRHLDGQRFDGFFHLLGIVHATSPGEDHMPWSVDIDRRQSAFDIDGAEAIAFTLLDGEGNEEAPSVAVEIGGRRHDTGIGIAVLHVELPEQIAIQIEPVRIVDISALEKAQQIGLRSRDYVTELRIAEGRMADEVDGTGLGAWSLADLEDNVDAVVIEVDNLGINLGSV